MRNFIFLFLVTFIFPFICNSSEANDVENIAISLGLEKGAKLTEISRRIEYLVNKSPPINRRIIPEIIAKKSKFILLCY